MSISVKLSLYDRSTGKENKTGSTRMSGEWFKS